MKTLVQIDAEIKSCELALANARKRQDQKAAKKVAKELEELRYYRLYLETTPSEATLERQLSDLTYRMQRNEERFGSWCAQKVGGQKELLAQYNRECETAKLKEQVKTLKYLLGL